MGSFEHHNYGMEGVISLITTQQRDLIEVR